VARRRPDEQSLVPLVDRLVDQRFAMAVESVSRLRAEFPTADADELADRLIRRCAKELALGGAMAGGAAASPVAGVAMAAATTGADATYSMGRLSELIMGLGLIYGHTEPTAQERAVWVWAVLGLSEGAAVGLTGLAARAGARGGARLVAKLPATTTAASATRSRRMLGKLSNSKGPWSLAALIPYGIGAGVGAAGNAVLAQSVGRAAKQYFSTGAAPHDAMGPPPGPAGYAEAVVEDAGEGEIVEGEVVDPVVEDGRADEDIVDAVIVETVVVETVTVDPPPRRS
jgi:hypothetical protein